MTKVSILMEAFASSVPAGTGMGAQAPRLHLLTVRVVHDQD